MSIDFFVGLRDLCNAEIERRKPLEVKLDEKDFEGLNWKTISGTKADYEQTTKEANEGSEVFQGLQQILKDHTGFMQTSTHKYWFHSGDINTIDRRQK